MDIASVLIFFWHSGPVYRHKNSSVNLWDSVHIPLRTAITTGVLHCTKNLIYIKFTQCKFVQKIANLG